VPTHKQTVVVVVQLAYVKLPKQSLGQQLLLPLLTHMLFAGKVVVLERQSCTKQN
jgi:hypothetical protein